MGIFKDIFAKTPKKGKILTAVGLGIGSVGLGLEFAETSLESQLVSEKYIFYILVLKYVCWGIGLFLSGAGITKVEPK